MTEVLAEVCRNKTIESIHYGSIVVCDKDGNILHYCGNPDKITFTRSAAKAFQFLAVYESGAIKEYGFEVSTSDSPELVVDCREALCYKTGTVTALNRLDVLMETEERIFYVCR